MVHLTQMNRHLEIVFFSVIMVAALFLFGTILLPYMNALVFAGAFALVFRPLYLKLLKSLKSEALTALVVIFIIASVVFVPLVFFGVKMVNQGSTLYNLLASDGGLNFGSTLNAFFAAHLASLRIPEITWSLNESVRAGLSWFTQNLVVFFAGTGQTLFTVFISLVGLFYFLKDGEKFKRWGLTFIPLESAYKEEIMREISLVMTSVIRGTLFVSVLQGLVAGIGFAIFGIPNPIFWGALVALCSPIPIIGTWLVLVPAIGYLFVTGHTGMSLGFLIWSFVTVNLIYIIVSPLLMRNEKNLHPYIILLSLIGGVSAFGPIGFLTGPLITAFLFGLLSIYQKLMANK